MFLVNFRAVRNWIRRAQKAFELRICCGSRKHGLTIIVTTADDYQREEQRELPQLVARSVRVAPPSASKQASKQAASKSKDKEQPGIGTVRRMMDHHACPKTRWDSAEMKNVDRGREREESSRRHGAEAISAIMKYDSDCFERPCPDSTGTRGNYYAPCNFRSSHSA